MFKDIVTKNTDIFVEKMREAFATKSFSHFINKQEMLQYVTNAPEGPL